MMRSCLVQLILDEVSSVWCSHIFEKVLEDIVKKMEQEAKEHSKRGSGNVDFNGGQR